MLIPGSCIELRVGRVMRTSKLVTGGPERFKVPKNSSTVSVVPVSASYMNQSTVTLGKIQISGVYVSSDEFRSYGIWSF